MSSIDVWTQIGIIAGSIVSVSTLIFWLLKPIKVFLERIDHWIDRVEETEQGVLDFGPILSEIHQDIKGLKTIVYDATKNVTILDTKVAALHTRVDRMEDVLYDSSLPPRRRQPGSKQSGVS